MQMQSPPENNNPAPNANKEKSKPALHTQDGIWVAAPNPPHTPPIQRSLDERLAVFRFCKMLIYSSVGFSVLPNDPAPRPAGADCNLDAMAGFTGAGLGRSICDSLRQNLLKCACEHCVSGVVLPSVENHPHLVEAVLLSLQELNNRPERNRRGQSNRIDERTGGNGRNRNAAQAVLGCDLQAATVGTRQQLWLMLIATSPDRADSMNHMSCFEVASAGDDGVADGTAA